MADVKPQHDVTELGEEGDGHQQLSQAGLSRLQDHRLHVPIQACMFLIVQAAVWSPLLQVGGETLFKPYFMPVRKVAYLSVAY